MRRSDLESDENIFDLRKRDGFTTEQRQTWRLAGAIPASQVEAACVAYNSGQPLSTCVEDAPIFEHRDFPGLQVIPGLLPPETQVLFTSCLMHRDLADSRHKINLQAEYNIRYPLESVVQLSTHRFDRSFFTRERAANDDLLLPKLPNKLKPLNSEQFLYSKLRWLTLGEQYDCKHYPGTNAK